MASTRVEKNKDLMINFDYKKLEKLEPNFDKDLNKKIFDYISQMAKMINTALNTNWKSESAKKDFKNKFIKIEKQFKNEFNSSAIKKKLCNNSGCDCKDCLQPKSKRWNAKKFNISIPKTEAPREEVLHYYRKKLDIKEIAVGRENHKDGTHHLHIYIEFVGKKNIKSPRYFDLNDDFKKYGNIHPNIDTLGKKTKESWFRYITMEDKNCISWGFNIWAERLGKLKPKDIAGKLINSEWSFRDWINYDPSILLTKNINKLYENIESNIKFCNQRLKTNYHLKL